MPGELVGKTASTSVENVAVMVGSAATLLGAVAPFKSMSPATSVLSVSATGSSSLLHAFTETYSVLRIK